MVSLQPHLTSLLKSLPPRPFDRHQLDELVSKTLEETRSLSSPENRKSQWEYLLKNEIFELAATEGRALKDKETSYYDDLRDRLDLVLTFTEHDACEQTFTFVALQDLLETQTIDSCSHIFSWIEARASRLTAGMVPQKGKALILLRTLNDLLRRLSKTGSTTIFCGRILTFLSGVFPLGERSGVNLRGEYGPTWEGVTYADKTKAMDADVEMKSEDTTEASGSPSGQDDKMQTDSKEQRRSVSAPSPAEKKADFYNTFWYLQLPFSKPTVFVSKNSFPEFREAVTKVMPVIKEATAKERAMMGSRVGAVNAASLKRKREPDAEETNNNEYFFAKFLTSPDLLDLEIADSHFRRQFLFQLLILLNHLLTFSKAAKSTWASSRNRSLQMDFTLDVADTQWVQETINKVLEELKQTTPNGRAFADTVNTILEREKNWVKWKNELCAPFDKEPWFVEKNGKKIGLFEAGEDVRKRMREPQPDWQHRLGSEPLTEIWDMGYRDLGDLQNPFQPGDVKDFVKKINQDDARIELRRKNLLRMKERMEAAQAKAVAAVKPTPPLPENTEANASTDQEMAAPSADSAMSSSQNSSTMHPSLPAKPESPAESASQEQATGPNAETPSISIQPPAPVPPPDEFANDEQILKLQESKQRWSWLALRMARDQYLQHFGKIGTGDVVLLQQEIEKERLEREKAQKSEETPGAVNVGPLEEHGSRSPMIGSVSMAAPELDDTAGPDAGLKMEADGEVKVEDR